MEAGDAKEGRASSTESSTEGPVLPPSDPSVVVGEREWDDAVSEAGKSTCSSNQPFGSPHPSEGDEPLFDAEGRRIHIKDTTPKSPAGSTLSATPGSAGAKRGRLSRVHRRNERGETPLHIAARKGEQKHVRALLREGGDVNCVDYAGWTPLHESCNHGWLKTAQACTSLKTAEMAVKTVLIHAGATVNLGSSANGDTPLHDAAYTGKQSLVLLLLQNGADRQATNKDGKRPAEVAGDHEIASLINNFRPEDYDPATTVVRPDELSSGSDSEEEGLKSRNRSYTPQSPELTIPTPGGALEPRRLEREFKEKEEEPSPKPQVPLETKKEEPKSPPPAAPNEAKAPEAKVVFTLDADREEGQCEDTEEEEGPSPPQESALSISPSAPSAPASLPSPTPSVPVTGTLRSSPLDHSLTRPSRALSVDTVEAPRLADASALTPRGRGRTSLRHQRPAPEALPKPKRARLEGQKRGRPPRGRPPGRSRGTARPLPAPSGPTDIYDFHSSDSDEPGDAGLFARKRDPSEGSQPPSRGGELCLGAEAATLPDSPAPVPVRPPTPQKPRLPPKFSAKALVPPSATAPSSLLIPPEPLHLPNQDPGVSVMSEDVSEEGVGPRVPPLRIIISRSGSGAASEDEGGEAGDSKGASEARLTRSRVRQGEGELLHPPGALGPQPPDLLDGLNHPHKRKQLKGARSLLDGAVSSGSTGHWSSTGANLNATSILNLSSFQAQRNLRNIIEAKWTEERRLPGAYQLPENLDEFLLSRKTYLLSRNLGEVGKREAPGSLGGELRALFERQETARVTLRRWQRVERERLILACEKEVLRVHTRASYAHPLMPPLSAVRVLRDADLANPLELDKPAPPPPGEREPLETLVEATLAKFSKLKLSLINRQLMEAASLQGEQQMSWEWEVERLGANDRERLPKTSPTSVPAVQVSLPRLSPTGLHAS